MCSVLYSPSCIVHREVHRALDYYSTVQIELAPQKTDPNVDLPRLIILKHKFWAH